MQPLTQPLKSLFISYDGLTDPLGQSQILPYQEGLAAGGVDVTILTAEKPTAYAKRAAEVKARVKKAGIDWHWIGYTKTPPILSTIWDIWRLHKLAMALHRQKTFQVVHCRSYIPAIVAFAMKKRFGCKVIFDIRGFWADERVDGGLWPQSHPLYRAVYRWFKRQEARWVAKADVIVSLTQAGAREMETWPAYHMNPTYRGTTDTIAVIPCAADFDFFTLRTDAERAEGRRLLSLPSEAFVVSYLGSLGTWYCLPEMLRFFKRVLEKRSDAYMVFLTGEPAEMVLQAARQEGIPTERVRTQYAERAQLNALMAAADVSLCFIKQAYSKLSSSPTKVGELLAKGIPVIANAGVGDMATQLQAIQQGGVLADFSEASFHDALDALDALLVIHPSILREHAAAYFGLQQAQSHYQGIYQRFTQVSETGLIPNLPA